MTMKTKQKTLSTKAKAAIRAYVQVRARKRGNFLHFLVEDTLKADRMPRNQLYDYLKRKGWHWNARLGLWIEKNR